MTSYDDIRSTLEDLLSDAAEKTEEAANAWQAADDAFEKADDLACALYGMIEKADEVGIPIEPAHDLIVQYCNYLEGARDEAADAEENWYAVEQCIESALDRMNWM